MNKIAIVTSICGNRDILSDPTVVHPNVDYFAFVDKKHDCKIWNQCQVFDFSTDEKYEHRRNAKLYKVLPTMFLSQYDYVFWVDATHDVVAKPEELIEKYLSFSDIAVFVHRERNCAYQEMDEIDSLGYDHLDNVSRQREFYKKEGFPENYGLYELPVILRKNTFETTKLNILWWEQICRFSSRDQLSFTYCLWKQNIQPTVLDGYANGINPKTGKIGNNDIIPQIRNHNV